MSEGSVQRGNTKSSDHSGSALTSVQQNPKTGPSIWLKYLSVDSERLSSRSSFQLEDEFLDTSEP